MHVEVSHFVKKYLETAFYEYEISNILRVSLQGQQAMLLEKISENYGKTMQKLTRICSIIVYIFDTVYCFQYAVYH